jgi:hypothetical protein
MFYQNSNDLVKNASGKSGHVQNSSETRGILMNQITSINEPVINDTSIGNKHEGDSLSIGTIFQNMVKTMIDNVSLKEGMESAGGVSNNQGGKGGGGTYNQSDGLKAIVDQEKSYTKQEVDHIDRMNSIVKLIDLDDKNRRQNWAEVTDSEGITKYGYITKDGIFQIWHFPSSTSSNPRNWLETDKMKQNTGLAGCPAASNTIQKITIAGSWDNLKPYEMAYAYSDSERTKPLFMMINTGVRNPNNTPGRRGLFSCGNESKNIFVSQRPSADFQFTNQGVDTHEMGCYSIPSNVSDRDFQNRGFTFQEDLYEASISQCKRRAEDLGSSYFMISGPEKGRPANKGGCWVYTSSGKPNISGILNFDANASKCYRIHNPEDDEDGFMKSYNTSDLKRLYGKENSYTDRSVALYCLKTGGLTGVDNENQNGRGYVGRIAYVDHSGDKRDYPSSALSFIKPTDKNPGSYINLGGYDTRSLEDSYSLTQITPGKANAAGNLLFRASRNGWNPSEWWRLCSNQGPTYTRAILSNGRVLGSYNSKGWVYNGGWYWIHDSESFVYDGSHKSYGSNSIWGNGYYTHLATDNRYFPYFAGYDMIIWNNILYTIGGAMHSDNNGRGPLGTQRWQWRWDGYYLQDLETYAVDSRFPSTNPPDYERKLRTLAVGQSVSATFEQCRTMCDDDEKCGGFVYTKGSAGSTGQCELKDRSKMYPVGYRTADSTKQLMLKVPTINSSITDEACKGRNGKYRQVDTAQYLHYPYTGQMDGNSKCDIKKIVPKKGSLNAQDATSMIKSVNTAFNETQTSMDIFRYQLKSSKDKTKKKDPLQEGYENIADNEPYSEVMKKVQKDLTRIANAEYQRERLIAMTDESNKQLISESYKFILWSILAILVVLALIKLKEMFGQDDEDEDGGDSGGGGFLATILALFGIGKVDTSDIADKTGDVKASLASAGEDIMKASDELSTNITEGADNLVSSANDAATGAIEGAKGLADKVSETATDAVNKVGDSVSGSAPSTGGRGKRK